MVKITPKVTTTPQKQTTTQVTAARIDPTRGRPNVGHIVTPYIQGLGGSIKMCVPSMGYKHTSKATRPLDRCYSHLRTRTQRIRRVG